MIAKIFAVDVDSRFIIIHRVHFDSDGSRKYPEPNYYRKVTPSSLRRLLIVIAGFYRTGGVVTLNFTRQSRSIPEFKGIFGG